MAGMDLPSPDSPPSPASPPSRRAPPLGRQALRTRGRGAADPADGDAGTAGGAAALRTQGRGAADAGAPR